MTEYISRGRPPMTYMHTHILHGLIWLVVCDVLISHSQSLLWDNGIPWPPLQQYKLQHTMDIVSGQRALKFLSFQDVDFLRDGTRRLEEFKFLMTMFDVAVKDQGLLCKNTTVMDCMNVFDRVIETSGVPTVTPKGRRWHLEKMKWTTYLINMPNKCWRVHHALLHTFNTFWTT